MALLALTTSHVFKDRKSKNHLYHEGGRTRTAAHRFAPTYLLDDLYADVVLNVPGVQTGSLENLKDASKFLADNKIVPLVSHVFNGLEDAENAFDLMKRGDQFGKIVIQISGEGQKSIGSKL